MFKSSLTWRRCIPTKHMMKFLLRVTFLKKGMEFKFFIFYTYQHFFSFFPKEEGLSYVGPFHWQKKFKVKA